MGQRTYSTNGIQISLVAIFVVAFSSIFISNTASGERIIDFQKVVDIDKQSLKENLSDLQKLPKIFPENVKSVELINELNEVKTVKILLDVNGFSIPSSIEVSNGEELQIIRITDGGLRGTQMITKLTKTWGFDGTPNQGTIVDVKMSLKTSGFLSLIGFIPDETVLFSIDKGLINIVSYSKSNKEVSELEESIEDPEDKEKSSKKVFKRPKKR